MLYITSIIGSYLPIISIRIKFGTHSETKTLPTVKTEQSKKCGKQIIFQNTTNIYHKISKPCYNFHVRKANGRQSTESHTQQRRQDDKHHKQTIIRCPARYGLS